MRFLFCPMATYGFVYPAIGIALELSRRGHDVAFVTDKSFDHVLAGEGLRRIPNGRSDRRSFIIGDWGEPVSVCSQVRHIRFALDEFRPDACVSSIFCFGALIARKLYDLPTAVIGLCTYMFAHPDDLRTQSEITPSTRSLQLSDGFRETYNTTGRLFKIPEMGLCEFIEEMPVLGDLFLLQNLDDLIEDSDRLPGRVHLVGPCGWDSPTTDSELVDWIRQGPAAGDPIIYAQPGALFGANSFWPVLTKALEDESVRVVASVGRMTGNGDYSSLPSNYFVRAHVPHRLVLQVADGVVTEGHTSIVLAALSAGVPLMLIPHGGEEFDCAEMCIRAGVCVGINHEELSRNNMKLKLRDLLQRTDIRERSTRIKTLIQNNNGHSRATDLIEILGMERRQILRSSLSAKNVHLSP